MIQKQDNNFKYWFWFAQKNQEELFAIINGMINDKVNEILPQKIEEQMRQYSVDIQTMINGKSSADLREIIVSEIQKNF